MNLFQSVAIERLITVILSTEIFQFGCVLNESEHGNSQYRKRLVDYHRI